MSVPNIRRLSTEEAEKIARKHSLDKVIIIATKDDEHWLTHYGTDPQQSLLARRLVDNFISLLTKAKELVG